MSAPLKLNATDLQDLAAALEGLSKTTRNTGVTIAPYGTAQIGVRDITLTIRWDQDSGLGEYVIDDRNGA